ncbi:MAG: DnaA/Hda family protein, partial [Chloroflexota bacterium]|nr:DnaA/Hda family protein [Chloroflexota bacterium]
MQYSSWYQGNHRNGASSASRAAGATRSLFQDFDEQPAAEAPEQSVALPPVLFTVTDVLAPDDDGALPSSNSTGAEVIAEPQWPAFDPHSVWQTLVSELALQMPSASYNTWVRDTWVIGYEDGEFMIGIPNAYARDWLENRLRNKIKRSLSSLVRRSVQVNFRVCPRQIVEATNAHSAPLYQMPIEEPVLHKAEGSATLAASAFVRNPSGQSTLPDEARSAPHGSSRLNAAHSFDTFIVGNHNKLAHAAAEAVGEKPGQSFNPLFVYGGVGLGKTHLLHAIGNRAQQLGYSMLYCSSEQFTNDLINSIRSQSTEQF